MFNMLITQDKIYAKKYYDLACLYPGPSTLIYFEDYNGFRVDGIVYSNDKLITCYKNDKTYLLKAFTEGENRRFSIFYNTIESELIDDSNYELKEIHRCITPFVYLHHEMHNFMMMPFYCNTVEVLKPISNIHLFWSNLSDALNFLHEKSFAHMDIKPANICPSWNMDKFVLIDLGSISIFGGRSESTIAYLPEDLNCVYACKDVDWWMLAATLAENIYGLELSRRKYKKSEILEKLDSNGELKALYFGIFEYLK